MPLRRLALLRALTFASRVRPKSSGLSYPNMHEASFHSRYAPDREAERFAELSLAGRHPSVAFILGGGENYLGKALKKLVPGIRTVLLQPCASFNGRLADSPDYLWTWNDTVSVTDFLLRSVADGKAAGGVAFLEWQPVTRAFPQESAALRDSLARALEYLSSAAATRSYWAWRWLRNSLRFGLSARRFCLPKRVSGPILLACAGPSLALTLRGYDQGSSNAALWALASAEAALRARDYEPELVIATDPGHWNDMHLRDTLRYGTPLAMSPSASAPRALLEGSSPILPLATGLAFEEAAIRAAGARAVKAGNAGTVAGTALSLALGTGAAKVYCIGMDLAADAARAHAEPYALDPIDHERSGRLSPRESLTAIGLYERFPDTRGDWRVSRAFNAYSADSYVLPEHRGRASRVSPSPVDTDIERMGARVFASELAACRRDGPPAGSLELYETDVKRPERASILLRWMEEEAHRLAGMIVREAQAGKFGPVGTEDALFLLALASSDAAPYIAEAARGLPSEQSSERALVGLKRGLVRVKELCDA